MSSPPSQEAVERRLEVANEALDEYADEYAKIERIEWTDDDLTVGSGQVRGLVADVNVLLGRLSGEVFGDGIDTSDAEDELRTANRYLRAYMNEKPVEQVSRR